MRTLSRGPLKISDPRSADQEGCDAMGEIAMLTRDTSHPSGVRMCMVITRALLIGQRRRGLLIKTQARACAIRPSRYPIYDRIGPTCRCLRAGFIQS